MNVKCPKCGERFELKDVASKGAQWGFGIIILIGGVVLGFMICLLLNIWE